MRRIIIVCLVLPLSFSAQAQDGWGKKLGQFLSELPLGEYYHKLTTYNDVQWVDPYALDSAQIYYRIVASTNVNVRAGASTENRIIASVEPGRHVKILGKKPLEPWFFVRLSDGTEGFIHESLLVAEKS